MDYVLVTGYGFSRMDNGGHSYSSYNRPRMEHILFRCLERCRQNRYYVYSKKRHQMMLQISLKMHLEIYLVDPYLNKNRRIVEESSIYIMLFYKNLQFSRLI